MFRRLLILCNKENKFELYSHTCSLISKNEFNGTIINGNSYIKYIGYNDNMFVIKTKAYHRLSILYKKEQNYCCAAMIPQKTIIDILNIISNNKEALTTFNKYITMEKELEKHLDNKVHNIHVYVKH